MEVEACISNEPVLLKFCLQSIQTCHITIGCDTQEPVGFVFMND